MVYIYIYTYITSKCRPVSFVILNLQAVFHTTYVCSYIYDLHQSEFHILISNDSLVTDKKSTVNEQLCEAAILSYYILRNNFSSYIFSKDLLPYIISAL